MILDVACGAKSFYFNKENPSVLFCDKRSEELTLCDGRVLKVSPDVLCDFKELPFSDNSFPLVIFDPPHLKHAGNKSWLKAKYGVLQEDWPNEIRQGFCECWRVLSGSGTLIFKWNEEQIKLREVLGALPESPIFGNRRAKTHWLVFFKGGV
jgi:hypothetical protein